MRLILNSPRKLSSIFTIPVDETPWVCNYRTSSQGNTPDRLTASFGSLTKALTSLVDGGDSPLERFGVYILAFGGCGESRLAPAFYVGVAGEGGKAPEGIPRRLRKHRVKVTGSHVGSRTSVLGGVNHTTGWRHYAIERHSYHVSNGLKDACDDARVVVGQLDSKVQATQSLEFFEHCIFKNVDGVRDALFELLWPDASLDPHLLIKAGKRGVAPLEPKIQLWNGAVFNM